MQSTGHSSRQDLSMTSMHGDAMKYGMWHSLIQGRGGPDGGMKQASPLRTKVIPLCLNVCRRGKIRRGAAAGDPIPLVTRTPSLECGPRGRYHYSPVDWANQKA